jgi:hypothetical protein
MLGNNDGNPNGLWYIGKSKIHGNGVIVSRDVGSGQWIGIAARYIFGLIPDITDDFGSMINHSYTPTSEIRYDHHRDVWALFSLWKLPQNTEVTVDYRKTPWFIAGPEDDYV